MLEKVRKALDDKVAQYTSYTYAMAVNNVREVQILVNEEDQPAKDYCSRMQDHPSIGNRARINSLTCAADLVSLLSRLEYRAYVSDSPVINRQYFLYITSDPSAVYQVDFRKYREHFTECGYDLLYLSYREPAVPPVSSFMRCLSTSPLDVHSGRVLVLDAAASGRILTFGTAVFKEKSCWYRLKTKEYSSVREEICEQIYSGLQPQLRGETPAVIKQKLSAMQNIYAPLVDSLQKNERNYPAARELPLAGYEQLCADLAHLFPRRGRAGTPKGTGISVLKTLSILFGTDNSLCAPEQLRKKLGQQVISLICRMKVRSCEKELTDYLFHHFTLQEICSPAGVAAWTSGESTRLLSEAESYEIQLNRYLNRTMFYTRSLSPEDLFQGLEFYFSAWDQYISLCFRKEWWAGVSELISETAGEKAAEFKALSDICEEISWSIDPGTIPAQSGLPLYSVDMVLNRIQAASALRTYTGQQLQQLAERESRLFVDAKGDMGDPMRKPLMCMLANSRLLSGGGKPGAADLKNGFEYRVNDMNWLIEPVSYVPDSVAYVIRITRVMPDTGTEQRHF